MAGAAHAFLGALGVAGLQLAAVRFEDTRARQDWHYVPRRRGGLSFRDMTATQQQLAYQLVAAGLSLPAFAAVTTIVGLEDVLDQIEGGRRARHRADYSITVFGLPGAARWGWRFEGHHVSLNVTLVDGAIAATPSFLGSNPAEVLAASGAIVVRPLAAEDDLARALVSNLSTAHIARATLSPEAPGDIRTRNAPTLDELPTGGVRLGDLRGSAATAAAALARHYLDRLPAQQADEWWRRLQEGYGDIRFAVAGPADAWTPDRIGPRLPQYYRLVGPSLLVEYDNTQDGANHVHTVLRDPGRDFGGDPLRDHLAAHHGAG